MYSANENDYKGTRVFPLYPHDVCHASIFIYVTCHITEIKGIDDYGIYQSVGGIVALLSFVNGALSAGSSSFFDI